VPDPAEFSDADTALRNAAGGLLEIVRQHLSEQAFHLALEAILRAVGEANRSVGIQWFQYEIQRLGTELVASRQETVEIRKRCDEVTEKYNDKRVEVETLKGKSAISIRNDILCALTLAAGSAGISVTIVYLDNPVTATLAKVGLGLSIVLFVCGSVLRRWR
jgi:hypothetical protein